MAKKKAKMSFDKICRIISNEWEEQFDVKKADQIAYWVDNLKSESTLSRIPASDRRAMIERVIEITGQKRAQKGGDEYVEANDRTFLALSSYLRKRSQQFRD